MGILFVESIKRLYRDGKIAKVKILELHKGNKITDKELKYILSMD